MLNRSQRTLCTVALSVLAGLAVPVSAQNNRSAVSVSGFDTASCTVPDPCRTFNTAITRTNAGGEIIVLTSGGYGPFSVPKSITIISPAGIYAGLAQMSGDAIVVNAGANDIVVLRGLFMNGFGSADFAIWSHTVKAIHVENCLISGFLDGIRMEVPSDLYVKDSFLRENRRAGILVRGDATARARAMIDNTRLERNGHAALNAGVWGDAFSDTTINRSIASGNHRGFQVTGIGTPSMVVENSVSTMNVVGLFAGGDSSAVMRVSGTTVTHNTSFGLEAQAGSQLTSRGNNTVIDNAGGETFTSSFPAK